MLGASGIPMVNWGSKSVILGSVAAGPYANYGNALIERATLAALGLTSDTPRFSLFEPMTETLARHINTFELAVFTGCTILDGRSGHQGFFNQHCSKIRIPNCFVRALIAASQATNLPATWLNGLTRRWLLATPGRTSI